MPIQLPTNEPDLSTLFEYMPAIAAGQVGTQQLRNQQNNKSLQDAFMAAQAHEAQSRPLDLLQKQATVRSTNAGAGYNEALAEHRKLGNTKESALLDSEIAAGKSKNKTQMSSDEITQMEQMGDLYRQVAAQVAGVPTPWGKVAKAKQLLGDHVKQGPEFDRFLLQNVNNLHTYFGDIGNNIYNASRAAKLEASKEEAALTRTREQIQGQKDIAQMGIDAGKYKGKGGGKSPEETLSKMGYEKASVYYDAKAEAAREIGDEKAATHYAEQADKMKSAYERAKILAAQAAGGGKLDLPAIAGKQATPIPQPQGFGQPTAPAAKPQANLQDVVKMYPGIPPAKLKEAYKKKFGVDLQ